MLAGRYSWALEHSQTSTGSFRDAEPPAFPRHSMITKPLGSFQMEERDYMCVQRYEHVRAFRLQRRSMISLFALWSWRCIRVLWVVSRSALSGYVGIQTCCLTTARDGRNGDRWEARVSKNPAQITRLGYPPLDLKVRILKVNSPCHSYM